MQKNYQQLTSSVRERINPENLPLPQAFIDELSTFSYIEVLTYVRLAMKSVQPKYTQRSKAAAEHVKQHLSKEINGVTFRYQGSIMTNTHIKGFSNIDLLAISDKFHSNDASNIKQALFNPESSARINQSSLGKEVDTANVIDELKTLRYKSETVLNKTYNQCDIFKPKAIKIKNLNLNIEVDTVIANWYNDTSLSTNTREDYRGVQIYNKDTNSRERANYPFLSTKRINERSSETNGRLQKMIRFLKNSKVNSDKNIDLSSFDINAICYDISTSCYKNLSFYELVLVIYDQMKLIATDNTIADNLVSVDGSEYIFRNRPAKKENLKLLLLEIEAIFVDLKNIMNI